MKIGMQELVVVLIVVTLIFGPTQIPKLTKMFGKSVKSFRDGMMEEKDDEEVPKAKTEKKSSKAEAAENTESGKEEDDG
ncbi:MAG: twin-arginine translocase TatA/TatE family subunit [Oscillospiraceae bacterium]|nr:twin-arginine translocase TatA/TatE family subunit [Oscillospiraceae bacterium]